MTMVIAERDIAISREGDDGCDDGGNNNYYFIPTAGNTMAGLRNRANCRASRLAVPHIRVRVYRIRGNGKIAWEQVRNRGREEFAALL